MTGTRLEVFATGSTPAHLEENAVAKAREVFGPDAELAVDPDYKLERPEGPAPYRFHAQVEVVRMPPPPWPVRRVEVFGASRAELEASAFLAAAPFYPEATRLVIANGYTVHDTDPLDHRPEPLTAMINLRPAHNGAI